jgi:multiple sugar transport system ATP-binding protein
MARVILENLVKTFPAADKSAAFTAVKGINLTVEDGEFMVLVGPSGCGKSTTLRMIAGLEEISGGTIRIEGQVVNDVLPKDRDIAMVFQNYALYPHMSVYDNLAFGLKLRQLPKSEIDARVRSAAELLGLADLLDRKPKALSGGQRQRVAVGRAIVRRPKVFLFDEPLSNLDAKMRVQMRAEIARLHARLGATMIYVTHDQVEAMTMGDRICVMREGRIEQVAEPLDLYQRPASLFVAGFIGSPAMNFLRGTLVRAGDSLHFVEQGGAAGHRLALPSRLALAAQPLEGKPMVLGARPEHVQLVAAGVPAGHPCTVELAEPMGAETFLHLKSAASTLVARVEPGGSHRLGTPVHVAFDVEKIHLFDATSENRVG